MQSRSHSCCDIPLCSLHGMPELDVNLEFIRRIFGCSTEFNNIPPYPQILVNIVAMCVALVNKEHLFYICSSCTSGEIG